MVSKVHDNRFWPVLEISLNAQCVLSLIEFELGTFLISVICAAD
jgi:hypothetical protein